MRLIVTIASVLLLHLSSPAQSYRKVDRFVHSLSEGRVDDVDSLAALIADSFGRETEQLRAAYGWVCLNIDYDVQRMANPMSYRGDSAIKVTLTKRKAICSGYADLLIHICRQLGVKAYYVSGYTRQNGVVVDQDHAWVAVRLKSGQWKLFDPTWGASLWQNGELVKRLSYEYFMVEPAEFIKSHMPFDPMWQLLYQPIKTPEFYGQRVVRDANYLFNYSDTISSYQILPEAKMYSDALLRMEWVGVGNQSSARYYSLLKKDLALAQQNESRALSDIWMYSLGEQEKGYQTSLEMYQQLVTLQTDYLSRGVSADQVLYLSNVLLTHSKDCMLALRKLGLSDHSDLTLLEELRLRTTRLHGLIEEQNRTIGELMRRRIIGK